MEDTLAHLHRHATRERVAYSFTVAKLLKNVSLTSASGSTISQLFGGDDANELVLPGDEAVSDAALPDRLLRKIMHLLQKRAYLDREKIKPIFREDNKAADTFREGLQTLPVQDILSYQSFLALLFDRIKSGSVCAAEFYVQVLLLSPMDRTVFFFHPMVMSAVMSLARKQLLQLSSPDGSVSEPTAVQRLLFTLTDLAGKWKLSKQLLNQFCDIFIDLLASNGTVLKDKHFTEFLPLAFVHTIDTLHGDDVAGNLAISICRRFVDILTKFVSTPAHSHCREVIHATMRHFVSKGKAEEALALSQHLCQQGAARAEGRRAVADSVVFLLDTVNHQEGQQEAVTKFITNVYKLSKSQKASHRLLCVDLAEHLLAMSEYHSGPISEMLLAIITERSKDVRPRVRVLAVKAMAQYCQKVDTTEIVDTRVASMLESRLPDPKAQVRMAALKLFETVNVLYFLLQYCALFGETKCKM